MVKLWKMNTMVMMLYMTKTSTFPPIPYPHPHSLPTHSPHTIITPYPHQTIWFLWEAAKNQLLDSNDNEQILEREVAKKLSEGFRMTINKFQQIFSEGAIWPDENMAVTNII